MRCPWHLCHGSLEFTEFTAELRSVQAMKPNASCRFQFFATSKANYEKPIICGFKSICFQSFIHLSCLVSTSPTWLSQTFVRKLLVQLLESTTTNAKAPMRQRCEHIFNQHRSLVAVGSGKTSGETMGNHYLWGINMFYRCGTDNMVNNKYNIQPIDFPMFSNQYNDGNKWVTTIY